MAGEDKHPVQTTISETQGQMGSGNQMGKRAGLGCFQELLDPGPQRHWDSWFLVSSSFHVFASFFSN